MTDYCTYCNTHPEDIFNHRYHATQYGFPLHADHLLFERLVWEINQAGLSWVLILKKAETFRRAYDGFDLPTVAAYGPAERARLLTDPGIIRNQRKVDAAIENARRILALYPQYGSFKGWLDAHHPLNKDEWTRLFKQTFVFTGSEIVSEFLMSTAYLPGAHTPACPVYAQVAQHNPPWMTAQAK